MSEIGVSDIVAVRDVSLQVQKVYIAILGRNGSGKSTLELFNALELPDQASGVFGMKIWMMSLFGR